MRMCLVNKNTPGVLGTITNEVGALSLNIVQAVNASRGQIACATPIARMATARCSRSAAAQPTKS